MKESLFARILSERITNVTEEQIRNVTKEQVRWIRRMARAIKDKPNGINLFADESGLNVVFTNEDGGFIFNGFEAVDIDTYIENIDPECGSGSR
jgi:hypothetical protein